MQIGKSGFKICRFKLRKIGTELQKIQSVEIGSIVKVKFLKRFFLESLYFQLLFPDIAKLFLQTIF